MNVAGTVHPVLTDRQSLALQLVGEGLSIEEIGVRMGVSARTAKDHVRVLRYKFGVSHKRHLIPIAKEMRP